MARDAECPETKDVFGRVRRTAMEPGTHRAWLCTQLAPEPLDRLWRQAAAAVRRSDGLAPDADAAMHATTKLAVTVSSFVHERFMAPLLREAVALVSAPPKDPKQVRKTQNAKRECLFKRK